MHDPLGYMHDVYGKPRRVQQQQPTRWGDWFARRVVEVEAALKAQGRAGADWYARSDGQVVVLENVAKYDLTEYWRAGLAKLKQRKVDDVLQSVRAQDREDWGARTTAAVAAAEEAGRTPLQRIEARAAELQKSDPKLTRPQAIDRVLKAEPGLYVEYKAAPGRPPDAGPSQPDDRQLQALADLHRLEHPELTAAQAYNAVYAQTRRR